MNATRKSIVLSIAIGMLIYVISYGFLVERGWPGSKVGNPEDRIPCPASYGFKVGYFFTPIHQVDRFFRYSYWHPIAKDLAAEIRAGSEIRHAKPNQ